MELSLAIYGNHEEFIMEMLPKLIKSLVAIALVISLSACAGMNTRDRNTAIGAGVGAVTGSALTDGSAGGAVGGAVVGGVIGNRWNDWNF